MGEGSVMPTLTSLDVPGVSDIPPPSSPLMSMSGAFFSSQVHLTLSPDPGLGPARLCRRPRRAASQSVQTNPPLQRSRADREPLR